jgi:uncharacterized membrane protein YgcG
MAPNVDGGQVTAGDVWRGFRGWRRRRPFWGCLFLLFSGAELFYTANASIAGLSLHLGPTGFLSYLLPLLLIVCALLCMFSPAQRLFYGIIALLTALYSFIGLNLGGFFIGMLLGIIGGALVIAWGPPRARPVNPDFVPIADQIALEQEAAETGEIRSLESPGGPDSVDVSGPSGDAETEHVEIAGHDDRPAPGTGLVPGFDDDQEGPKSGARRSRLSRNPKALTVALIVMGLTAAMLAVGSRVPASAAADCPPGLPSISASASPSRTTAAADKAAAGSSSSGSSGSSSGSSSGGSSSGGSASGGSSSGGSSSGASSTPTPTASPSTDKDGNPIVDGVKGIVGGLGNLLGLGDDDPSSSSSPSGLPSSPETPTVAPTVVPSPTGDASAPVSSAPAPPASSSATSPAPSESSDAIPCLGPRILGLKASGSGVPLIAAKPGLLETDSLTMLGATYDGVVNLPSGTGTSARVLKFSMDSAENKPFSLTVDEASGAQTVITSNDLTTSGNVKFYTQRFEGKLFGVIPVVFTPDQPPPLTVAIMWFTDVKIELNFVQCDKLTGFPLHISEK